MVLNPFIRVGKAKIKKTFLLYLRDIDIIQLGKRKKISYFYFILDLMPLCSDSIFISYAVIPFLFHTSFGVVVRISPST